MADKRSFELGKEQALFIDEQVSSGTYASADDVVDAGLRALQDREAAVERWLLDQVAPTYDAMKADPSRAIPLETVFANLRARHAGRVKGGA